MGVELFSKEAERGRTTASRCLTLPTGPGQKRNGFRGSRTKKPFVNWIAAKTSAASSEGPLAIGASLMRPAKKPFDFPPC